MKPGVGQRGLDPVVDDRFFTVDAVMRRAWMSAIRPWSTYSVVNRS
jgi:hypothetical protein